MSGSTRRLEWQHIPSCSFQMGSDLRPEEGPIHVVELSGFWLARTQVTRALYQDFLDATVHPAPPFWDEPCFADPRMPAVGPSWHDAVAFCRWFSEGRGFEVRLPTEAEWECSAKAGRNVLFPWGGDRAEELPGYGERWKHGPEPVDAWPTLHPLGIFGLGENVHEWCSDWFDAGYYAQSPLRDPQGPTSGRRRASRGGSWRHRIPVSRCAARASIPPDRRYNDFGFRLCSSFRPTD